MVNELLLNELHYWIEHVNWGWVCFTWAVLGPLLTLIKLQSKEKLPEILNWAILISAGPALWSMFVVGLLELRFCSTDKNGARWR